MSDQLTVTWPPPYIVRRHPRARNVKLRASKAKGLEITVPSRFVLKHLPDVLERNKSWIIKQLNKIEIKREWELPGEIHLAAINERWRVVYVQSTGKLRLFERPFKELVLLGNIEEKIKCQKLLLTWTRERAGLFLTCVLNEISARTKLSYNKISIRDQKTRWGSCNSEKNIALNFKLIFFPSSLMQNILIHELCHTRYLNHSTRFWNLVKQYDPQCEEHKRALRKASHFVPDWVELT